MKPDRNRHKDQKFIIENARRQIARRGLEQPQAPDKKIMACSTRQEAERQSKSPTEDVAKYVGYLELVAELQSACDRGVAETEAASARKPSLLRRILSFVLGRRGPE